MFSNMNWLSKRSAKPIEVFGAPGQGRSLLISFISAFGLLLMWQVVTSFGWVKPLFLPSPEAVFNRFLDVVGETS